MKKRIFSVLGIVLAAFSSDGQGTFVYDQQSANESSGGGATAAIQPNQPIGQSFTPAFDSVGFIRLYLGDSSFNAVGATIHVNLLTNSITGPVLGSTDPVFMSDGFVGYVNFFFPVPVPLTPGLTYYFRPIVESGDTWAVIGYPYNYSGGTAFFNGTPNANNDLWFREGIIVPEPSSALLVLFSGSAMVWLWRKRA